MRRLAALPPPAPTRAGPSSLVTVTASCRGAPCEFDDADDDGERQLRTRV
jgi:hypothetical protein